MVEPLLTRFIRIYPERATPAGMGLRLELIGCEIEGAKTSHDVSQSVTGQLGENVKVDLNDKELFYFMAPFTPIATINGQYIELHI